MAACAVIVEGWPIPSLLACAESSLRPYFASRADLADAWPVRRLHEYKRQYIGLAPAGGRVVLIQFVHGSRAADGRWLRWRRDETVGGGGYYFRIVCDPRRRVFSGLEFNAEL
ncbi:MAG TPA: hypothetical protein VEO54_12060 [Thermoanaerobaculia bacterium]|nr:hypothetical protein [Thermoanaerobaculia bacterium]